MSDTLVNPRSYVVGTVKEMDPRFAGGKYYLAKLGGLQPVLVGVQRHKRASEAEKEALEWRDRLVVEYDAHLLALAGVSDGMGEPGVPATAEGLPNRSEA